MTGSRIYLPLGSTNASRSSSNEHRIFAFCPRDLGSEPGGADALVLTCLVLVGGLTVVGFFAAEDTTAVFLAVLVVAFEDVVFAFLIVLGAVVVFLPGKDNIFLSTRIFSLASFIKI